MFHVKTKILFTLRKTRKYMYIHYKMVFKYFNGMFDT